jgi:hypothetical protein
MCIPGIDVKHLERQHWCYAGGRGALGYRHLPSGGLVLHECPPGVPVRVIDAELLAELQEKLRLRGVLPGEITAKAEPT